jgi:hypothetical protein
LLPYGQIRTQHNASLLRSIVSSYNKIPAKLDKRVVTVALHNITQLLLACREAAAGPLGELPGMKPHQCALAGTAFKLWLLSSQGRNVYTSKVHTAITPDGDQYVFVLQSNGCCL